MSDTKSREWQVADRAFNNTQSQFLDRTRAFKERDTEISEREEKTRRLKAARLEREQAGKNFAATPENRNNKK